MRPTVLDGNWNQTFRASPYWLRFELGGEVLSNTAQPIPRFIQAFHRAQNVASALFAGSSAITAILAASPDSTRDGFAPTADAFGALETMGFELPRPGINGPRHLIR